MSVSAAGARFRCGMRIFASTRHLAASITSGLRSLAEFLGQFPSFGYGFAYVLAIPVFASLYARLPFDFYHSTAKYEPLVTGQSSLIAGRLRQTFLLDAIQSSTARPSLDGQGVHASPDGVFPAFSIDPEPDRVRVNAIFLREGAIDSKDLFLKIALDIDDAANLHPATDVALTNDRSQLFNTLLWVEVKARVLSGGEVPLPLLFPCGKRSPSDRSTCIRMTLEDYSALLSLESTAGGRPTPAQGSYLRMLYFSAVTISTLGYGDIVPLTSRARALVTIEVIFGPLLFGLFLNSLFREGAASASNGRKGVRNM